MKVPDWLKQPAPWLFYPIAVTIPVVLTLTTANKKDAALWDLWFVAMFTITMIRAQKRNK